MKESVPRTVVTLLLISTLPSILNVYPARASGTIRIKPDGSIEPLLAPISTTDSVTYVFADNIYNSIVVERDNIIIDGAYHTIRGAGDSNGITLSGKNNVTIRHVTIEAFDKAIYVNSSSNIAILENNITANGCGIHLASSTNSLICRNSIIANAEYGILLVLLSNYNTIFANRIASSSHGIKFDYSASYNTVSANDIMANEVGMLLIVSSSNYIYHNNFLNNALQAYAESSLNSWDDGYPSGGNYWSDYNGTDLDSDGIRSTAYAIRLNNQDNHPLAGTFHDSLVTVEQGMQYHVQVVSNSSVSNIEVFRWLSSPTKYLQPGQQFIRFLVTGAENTSGFSRVTIPRTVLDSNYLVLVDWRHIPSTEFELSNSTHAYLYFTYSHSEHEVIIIQKLPIALSYLDAQPKTLNLKGSQGWITVIFELPDTYDASIQDIDVSTIVLNDTVRIDMTAPIVIRESNNTFPDLMVNFDKIMFSEYVLSKGITHGNVTLTVTGHLNDGTGFIGSGTIKVRISGDIDADGSVTLKDVYHAANAFGSYAGHIRWNPAVDENGDNLIDLKDILIVWKNYGKVYK